MNKDFGLRTQDSYISYPYGIYNCVLFFMLNNNRHPWHIRAPLHYEYSDYFDPFRRPWVYFAQDEAIITELHNEEN